MQQQEGNTANHNDLNNFQKTPVPTPRFKRKTTEVACTAKTFIDAKTDVAKFNAEKHQNNNNEKMQQNTNYKYQHYNPPAQNLSQDSGLSPRYDVLSFCFDEKKSCVYDNYDLIYHMIQRSCS